MTRHRSLRTADAPRVLIIAQNLRVPFDRRVWLECRALTAAGYAATIVCPEGRDDPSFQVLAGVSLYKYRPYAPGGSALSFVIKYTYSFLATAALVWRAHRNGRFDVIQACNPPDIFWPIARWLLARDGSRFVFDHHDLCPELYDSRFPAGSRLPRRGLLALDRATFRTADRVISTNSSYAEVAVQRGGRQREHATVVRTGPDPLRLQSREQVPARRRGRRHLVTYIYIGVMGPRDGVDLAIQAAAHIVHDLGREDVSFTLMGSGDCYSDLMPLRDELGLQDYVSMPGRVPDETVVEVMSTAAVGLSADPKNPLNDVSTMNKTLEHTAFGLPVVAFDLKEARVSAEEAAVYVPGNDVKAFAHAIITGLDDEPQRATMGAVGRARIIRELGWPHQEARYVGVYDALLDRRSAPGVAIVLPQDALTADHRAALPGGGVRVAGAFRRPDGVRLVQIMVDRIAHRGPDAVGVRELVTDTSTVRLAHRRLPIVDLTSAADQPFVRNGFHLSHNGELSNCRQLRRDLGAACVTFATTSDADVVLKAWRAWGPGALPRLRGRFAFARYDERAGELSLARDPLRIKPLYVMSCVDRIRFASEPKAIIAGAGPELAVNRQSLITCMVFYFLPEDVTSVSGVCTMPPDSWAGHRSRRQRPSAEVSCTDAAGPGGRPQCGPAASRCARARPPLHLRGDVPSRLRRTVGGGSLPAHVQPLRPERSDRRARLRREPCVDAVVQDHRRLYEAGSVAEHDKCSCLTNGRLFLAGLNRAHTNRSSTTDHTQVRVPFVDIRVLRAAVTFGGTNKIRRRDQKVPLREAADAASQRSSGRSPGDLSGRPVRPGGRSR